MSIKSIRHNFSRPLRLFALAFVCLFAALQAAAQGLTAQVEEVGGYYRLSFEVASRDVSGFTPPSLADFEVLSGPSTSTSSSYEIINGHASHSESTTFTYILSAKRGGRLTIGSASVRAGGRVLRSRAVVVNARTGGGSGAASASSRATQGHSAASSGVQQRGSAVTQRDLFVDMTPSRTRVREQEAVLLTYRVHARAGVGLYNTQLLSKPDFQGVLSQEIPLPGNQVQMSLEHRGGETYRAGVILQYLVFPQKSGQVTIPSITFNCTVVQQDNTLDLADAFFNGGGMTGVTVDRSVPAATIHVDALPQPKPADFSGAVGKFSIEGRLLNSEIRTNDVATYRVTLSGLGNLKLVTPPKIAFPKDFDTYDPKTDDKTRVTAGGVSGELVFDYTFVPRNVGKYTIPAVDFVYFDTSAGAYRTLTAPAREIDVARGTKSNEDVDRQLAMLRSDIRAPHAVGDGAAHGVEWGSAAYCLLTALFVAVLFVLAFVLKKYRAGLGDTKAKRCGRAASAALSAAGQARKELLAGGDTRSYYAALYKAVCTLACDSFGLERSDLSADRLPAQLSGKGVDETLAAAYVSALADLERAQYAPGGEAERDEVYGQVRRLAESTSDWQKTHGRRKGLFGSCRG